MQWKQHPDIDRLEVSDEGFIRNKMTKHLYVTHLNRGYVRITLSLNNNNKHFRVHRLVAQTYLENPKGLPQVNHINGDKTDNSVSNLEWVTAQENMLHAYSIGLRHACLTEDQKSFIREHYTPRHKQYGGRPLSRLFNVPEKAVYGYVHNHPNEFTRCP